MVTARGGWFLLINILLLAVAIVSNTPPVALVCLTLLGWFLWTWAVFVVRLRLTLGRLLVERVVRDERGPLESLWAGRTYTIDTKLTTAAVVASPYLRLTEWLALGATSAGGTTESDGVVAADRSLDRLRKC